MRTALWLLLLLGVAAVPGSLLPQRSVSPFAVGEYRREHPDLAPLMDAVGLFEVYSSPWFSAVYLLLFVSLTGCIIPRWAALWRARRDVPGTIPTNLARLEGRTDAVEAEPRWREAATWARRHGYRVRVGDGELAAERGLWRELANLVFHTSLLGALVAVAVSSLFGHRGTAMVVEGSGFSNVVSQYDELTGGGQFSGSMLRPFTVNVEKFTVEFETEGSRVGQARFYEARVRVTDGGQTRDATIAVNHPLDVGGTQLHLLGHGYAPEVRVTDGNGDVAFAGPVVFLPQDGNFSSKGVIKAPDARPQRLGFEALFLPTATVDAMGPRSLFPDALRPRLFTNAWAGPPQQASGLPENVHQLNTAGMTRLDVDGQVFSARLAPGETVKLPGGGALTLTGWRPWVKLQVSTNPGLGVALLFALLAAAGMTVSLFVHPRRLYARLSTADDGRVLETAGLDRVEGRPGRERDIDAWRAALLGESSEGDEL